MNCLRCDDWSFVCHPNADISFVDYGDPSDGLLLSENADKEVETKQSLSLEALKI